MIKNATYLKFMLMTFLVSASAICTAQWTLHGTNPGGADGMDVNAFAKIGRTIAAPSDEYVASAIDPTGAAGCGVLIYKRDGSLWLISGVITLPDLLVADNVTLDMPDNATLAIGVSKVYSVDHKGYVTVHGYDDTDLEFKPKGPTFLGENDFDNLGEDICMPDANTIAVGVPGDDNDNGANAGKVMIYTWNGGDSTWVQKGADIMGESAADRSGIAVSMPDANTIAIGAAENAPGELEFAGHVRIYEWDGSNWVQKGIDLDGVAENDSQGWSVDMPDANTVAVGAPGANDSKGSVKIYTWDGSAWVQKGTTLEGLETLDRFGHSVSMAGANTIAVGAPNSNMACGKAHVFAWDGTDWVRKGLHFYGVRPDTKVGEDVVMVDPFTVAVGSPGYSENYVDGGVVEMFRASPTTGMDEVNEIDFNVYPNPNNGQFAVNLPELAEPTSITIYAIDGSVVYRLNQAQQGENLIQTELADGVYQVMVSNSLGNSVTKMVIQ